MVFVCRSNVSKRYGSRFFLRNHIAYRRSAVNGHPNGMIGLFLRCPSFDSSLAGRLNLSCQVLALSLLNSGEFLGEEIVVAHIDIDLFSAISTGVYCFVLIRPP